MDSFTCDDSGDLVAEIEGEKLLAKNSRHKKIILLNVAMCNVAKNVFVTLDVTCFKDIGM